MFSISTVASSTRMPTASARPPRVIRLRVSPSRKSTISEQIDSGMDTAMMQVVRQLPRNSRIIAAVSEAAIRASWSTLPMAARTNSDWSNISLTFMSSGSFSRMRGISLHLVHHLQRGHAATLNTEVRMPRSRSGARWWWRPAPSRTLATSRMDGLAADGLDRDVADLGDGRHRAVEGHVVFLLPILMMPVGRVRVWLPMALVTSAG
jgi:hypothetical protein